MRRFKERALGTSIKEIQLFYNMATRKRARGAEIFYRNLERGVGLKAETICQKNPRKDGSRKNYAIEESACLFGLNRFI